MHGNARHLPLPRCAAAGCAAVLLLALAACGGDDDANRARADGEGEVGTTALPAPEGATGSVTGMPANPSPGTTRIEPIEPVAIGSGEGGAGPASEPRVGAPEPQVIRVPPPPDIDAAMADIDPDLPPLRLPPAPEAPPAPPLPGTPSRDAAPIGTEAATESTTIVVEEPADTGG